ncbi:PI-PLC domain-containing protein [Taibaiella helva]|uniref:hypothetical protein n=1 Tax=Taibaiella helva TaxID=2301235 RepID=UPI000E581E04|nr:hypothetical protein [Taibaiella helva]
MNTTALKHLLSCLFLAVCLVGAIPCAKAQQLAFQQPAKLTIQAQSDKAPVLLHAAGAYLAAWKSPGAQGHIQLATWPDKGQVAPTETTLADAITGEQPALVAAGADRYLFWRDTAGALRYKYCPERGAWDVVPVQSLDIAAGAGGEGLTAACVSGKIVLVNRCRGKDRQWMAVLEIAPDGILHTLSFRELSGSRSAALSFILAGEETVRFCRSNGAQLYYRDYQVVQSRFGPEQSLSAGSLITAMGGLLDGDRSISLWRSRTDRQWHYQVTTASGSGAAAAIPGFPDTELPVALCPTENGGVLLACTGADQQIYIINGDAYDPASWMGSALFPGKADYTLRDIVLPGAHDAGMSILNAVGGKSTYTINECNTLTQKLPVAQQLRAGIRMFDLRIDRYQGALYTKHAPSDCMDDAVGGGYGERLDTVLYSVKRFLEAYPQEFVLLSFCHFCDRYMTVAEQGRAITTMLGADKVFYPAGRQLGDIPLSELAGKVIVSFEEHDFPQSGIVANTMTDRSTAFFNYKRRYAGTNSLDTLLLSQKNFFTGLKGKTDRNDIIRVDWQLTQAGQEAAISCSQFQSENANLLLDGALLLVNAIRKNKSIISLALWGNRYLAAQLQQWIAEGIIDRENKPNILYVDAANGWITDICVGLNRSTLYQK